MSGIPKRESNRQQFPLSEFRIEATSREDLAHFNNVSH